MVRITKDDAVFLEQSVEEEDATKQLPITRQEFDSLVQFFRAPVEGRNTYYRSRFEPLIVSYNGQDYSYTIERDGTCLAGVRYPPGVEPPATTEPEPEAKEKWGFVRMLLGN